MKTCVWKCSHSYFLPVWILLKEKEFKLDFSTGHTLNFPSISSCLSKLYQPLKSGASFSTEENSFDVEICSRRLRTVTAEYPFAPVRHNHFSILLY